MDKNKLAESYSNSKYGNYSDTVINAFLAGFDSCMTELAKQSGEYKTSFVLFTGKEALIARDKPTRKLHPDDSEVKMIDHAAILAANAKIQELEDFRQAQVEEIKRCDSNLKLLNNKIKELEQELKTKTLQFEKAFEVNQECNRKLQEAEKVIEFIADEFVEWSKMKERARTYLQNKGE